MDNKLDDEYETLRKFNAKNKRAVWWLVFAMALNMGGAIFNLIFALNAIHDIF